MIKHLRITASESHGLITCKVTGPKQIRENMPWPINFRVSVYREKWLERQSFNRAYDIHEMAEKLVMPYFSSVDYLFADRVADEVARAIENVATRDAAIA